MIVVGVVVLVVECVVDVVLAVVDVVDEAAEVVLVVGAVYWKVTVPLAPFESVAVMTYVPDTHAEVPPTFVA